MAFNKTFWKQIETDYETGNYTVKELSKKYEVSVISIDKHKSKEKWVKGALIPIVNKQIQETSMAVFDRIGLPKQKVFELIMDGMSATRLTFHGKGEQAFAEEVPDYTARVKYIEQFCKITGLYSAEKHEVMGIQVVKLSDEDDSL